MAVELKAGGVEVARIKAWKPKQLLDDQRKEIRKLLKCDSK